MSNFLNCQLYDHVGVFTVFPYHHFNGCNIWSVSLSIPDIADTHLLSIHLYWSFRSILLIFFEERYFCFIEFPYCVLVSNSVSFCFYLYNCPPVNISWYAFPSLHDFSHISHIFISLTEVYPYYFFFWEISSFTYGLLRSSLFNFQLFGDFPIVFLLLISSVISLWPENILCIIFIILTF